MGNTEISNCGISCFLQTYTLGKLVLKAETIPAFMEDLQSVQATSDVDDLVPLC